MEKLLNQTKYLPFLRCCIYECLLQDIEVLAGTSAQVSHLDGQLS